MIVSSALTIPMMFGVVIPKSSKVNEVVAVPVRVSPRSVAVAAKTTDFVTPCAVRSPVNIAVTGNSMQTAMTPGTGKLVKQTGPGTSADIAGGLTAPIALRVGPDGAAYVASPAVGADDNEGTIVKIALSQPLAASRWPMAASLGDRRPARSAPSLPPATRGKGWSLRDIPTTGARRYHSRMDEPSRDLAAPDPEPGIARRHPRELWIKHGVASPGFPRFLITIAFLVTFAVVRTITYGIRDGWMPVGNIQTGGGLHIHHYVWGIGLLFAVAYVQVAFAPHRGRNLCAVLLGIAEALILDEFALLLNLRDVYWTGQGRESIDAAVVAVCLLLILTFARPFLRELVKEARRL